MEMVEISNSVKFNVWLIWFFVELKDLYPNLCWVSFKNVELGNYVWSKYLSTLVVFMQKKYRILSFEFLDHF
jgi:hypothetical protein